MSHILPPHFPTFLKKGKVLGWERGHTTLSIDRDVLKSLISNFLAVVPVDEAWYQETYPDVAAEVANRDIASATAHYRQFGYFEGRFPSLAFFDAHSYAAANPDVAQTIGTDANGLTKHFMEHGYAEGRPLMPADGSTGVAEANG